MLFLDQQELCELTGRIRHDAQATQLNRMAIVHKIRADGMPMVLRSHILKAFAGSSETPTQKDIEPKWDMVNA